MKLHLLVLSLALSTAPGLSSAAPDSEPARSGPSAPSDALATLLKAQEIETWEAVKRHDAASFASLCLDSAFEIYGDGSLLPVKDVIAQIPDTEIPEYKVEDMQVFQVSAETALVRYRVFAKVSYKGETAPPRWMLATAVWIQTPKGWKAAMYQETPLPN